jgi:hypothetical protein
MSRFAFSRFAILSLIFSISSLTGCGGGSSNSNQPTPVSVALSPTANPQSLDVGSTLQFVATPQNSSRQAVTVPVTYLSSDTSVLTFVSAAGGLACAGRWDALGQVCTPGSSGVAQVTAVANGVSSPSITVYVHDHVARIVVQQFSPTTPPPPPVPCVTSAKINGVSNYLDFEAFAFASDGTDITNTVGSLRFQQVSGSVVSLNTSEPELNNNNGMQVTQVRATAGSPGITQIYASAAGVNSAPVPFETCLIQSIQLQVGSATTNTSFTVAKGTATDVTATVLDRLNYQLDKAPLTWSSLSPSNATVTSTGAVTTTNVGGTSITASCIPPTCNVGSANGQPPTHHPVYPTNVITGTITGAGAPSTVYVTSTCTVAGAPIPGCQPALLPITTKDNLIGNRVVLPSAPNSFIFDPLGKKGYLGSTQGLMVFTPGGASGTSPITQYNSAPGKLLAVSNDGNTALVGDTVSVPNQVYLVDTSGTTASLISLQIPGATAAAFSPDGFKIFIIGNPVGSNASTLYVYSPFESLKSIPLSGPTKAVGFYANGGFAYLNGGAPNALTAYNTCDNSVAEASIPVPRLPALFQVAMDGVHAVGLDSPGLDLFTTAPLPSGATCPYSITTSNTFIDLGQGEFTPIQLIVTPDSQKAYILTSNLGSVFVYNFGVNTVDAIPLAGNPAPLNASLSADGSQLYVGASDGEVHAISTATGVDLSQITFPPNEGTNNNALCTNIPGSCVPDLLAFQP